MKKSTFTIVLFTQLIVIVLSQLTIASAQKLPKVQTSSVRAPANIKIDGKATEWNDQFQAHNFGNHIYYTLSNDADNLYLTVRMDDIMGDKKIFKGGLTFTIIPLTKTVSKLSLTYPYISWEKPRQLREGNGNHLTLYSTLNPDKEADKAKIDSLIDLSNAEIIKTYKEIYITGISEIDNHLLSVYNSLGVKVGASFDKKMRYTYELAIPLKYLETSISDTKSIKYNIKLNTLPAGKRTTATGTDNTVVFPTNPPPVNIDDMFNFDDTDFSGAYTLALKP